jgi:hypothetical protein
LRTHIIAFLRIIIGNCIKIIGEEKHPQDAEHDEELDEDKQPQRLANGHAPEAIDIEMPYLGEYVLHLSMI